MRLLSSLTIGSSAWFPACPATSRESLPLECAWCAWNCMHHPVHISSRGMLDNGLLWNQSPGCTWWKHEITSPQTRVSRTVSLCTKASCPFDGDVCLLMKQQETTISTTKVCHRIPPSDTLTMNVLTIQFHGLWMCIYFISSYDFRCIYVFIYECIYLVYSCLFKSSIHAGCPGSMY